MEVVVWLYTSKERGTQGIQQQPGCPTNFDHTALWYLFGKDECQIGKTLVVAVMVVVARDSKTVCFILTSLRIHVEDVATKTRQFLQMGSAGHWFPSSYDVQQLAGRLGDARLKELAGGLMYKTTLIASYRSQAQLDTICALRVRMYFDCANSPTALPFFGGDEWDLTKSSPGECTVMERARAAVLGQKSGDVKSYCKWQVIVSNQWNETEFHLPEPAAVVVMTSTPEGFLMNLSDKGLELAGCVAWVVAIQ